MPARAGINGVAHISDRLPGPTWAGVDPDIASPAPGRTTLAAAEPPAAAPANDVLAVHTILREHLERFIDARAQYARIAATTGGPGVEALRAQLVTHARALSAAVLAQADAIRRLDNMAINELAIAAAHVLSQSPEAMTDLSIAQDLSMAAAALEVGLDVAANPTGTPALASLGRVAGVLSGVAGLIYNGATLVMPGGNVGDAVAVGGGILGIIAAARGSTPLGLASIVVEQLGTAIANSIRGQSDRDAIRDALVAEGVPAQVANAIANGEPEIMRELRDYGVSSARVVEIAGIAPNLLTNGNPILTPAALREIIRWGETPITAERRRILEMWNDQLD